MSFDAELDAKGLNCPLPILRAKKAIAELSSGQVLKIVATDPGSVKDFEALVTGPYRNKFGKDCSVYSVALSDGTHIIK